MNQPTKQQWDEFKQVLSGRYGSQYLQCDGYGASGVVMSEFDKQLVVDFLEENLAAFAHFISERDIEASEAESIVDNLKFS